MYIAGASVSPESRPRPQGKAQGPGQAQGPRLHLPLPRWASGMPSPPSKMQGQGHSHMYAHMSNPFTARKGWFSASHRARPGAGECVGTKWGSHWPNHSLQKRPKLAAVTSSNAPHQSSHGAKPIFSHKWHLLTHPRPWAMEAQDPSPPRRWSVATYTMGTFLSGKGAKAPATKPPSLDPLTAIPVPYIQELSPRPMAFSVTTTSHAAPGEPLFFLSLLSNLVGDSIAEGRRYPCPVSRCENSLRGAKAPEHRVEKVQGCGLFPDP